MTSGETIDGIVRNFWRFFATQARCLLPPFSCASGCTHDRGGAEGVDAVCEGCGQAPPGRAQPAPALDFGVLAGSLALMHSSKALRHRIFAPVRRGTWLRSVASGTPGQSAMRHGASCFGGRGRTALSPRSPVLADRDGRLVDDGGVAPSAVTVPASASSGNGSSHSGRTGLSPSRPGVKRRRRDGDLAPLAPTLNTGPAIRRRQDP